MNRAGLQQNAPKNAPKPRQVLMRAAAHSLSFRETTTPLCMRVGWPRPACWLWAVADDCYRGCSNRLVSSPPVSYGQERAVETRHGQTPQQGSNSCGDSSCKRHTQRRQYYETQSNSKGWGWVLGNGRETTGLRVELLSETCRNRLCKDCCYHQTLSCQLIRYN